MLHKVVCQKWNEDEVGWGTRPDGYTLHLNLDNRKAFVQKNDEEIKQRGKLKDGDEYSTPSGDPYFCEVDDKDYQNITNNIQKYGVWYYGRKAPKQI